MADVFVSYKAEDRPRILPLAQALQADGYSVWWDQYIGTGDEWRQTIEQQLDSAKSVIVVWSKRSVGPQGQFVRDEATRAQQRRVYVPLTIDTVRIPLGFGERQTTSLKGWKGDRSDARYQAVLAAVRRTAGAGSGGTPGDSSQSGGMDRRALIAGAAVAAVGLGGIGAWALVIRASANASVSIAVLPFANLSGDPAQAYFADGIAGEIRTTLTRLGRLRVAGSTSSEAVRNEDAQTAAKKLGVANILTGNVRQTPSTIRVNAELIDGHTGLAKWSQNYDRAPGDVIKIQTNIAENVASALAVALTADTRKALSAGETSNVAAQQLVFQARDISWQLTVPALQRSVQLLDQAISLDPNYARAYAVKSFVLNNLATVREGSPEELTRGRAEALQYARTALSIAPNLPLAHSALGFAYSSSLQMSEAVREQTVALSLASGDPDVMRNYGLTISGVGRSDEALRYVDEARKLDPLNYASHWAHASVLYEARRYVEAVRYLLSLKKQSPELFKFPDLLGNSLLMLGRTKEAAAAFCEIDDPVWRLETDALIAARTGNRKVAVAKLAALRQRQSSSSSFFYARIYAQLGDSDAAFDQLNRAWERRDETLTNLMVDPYLAPLRPDERYAALLQKMHFPV